MKSMIPLGLFLLGCAAIYVGTIQAAFSALMRLSLRIGAERSGVTPVLERYLREPMMLFVPARLLLGIILVLVCGLVALLLDVASLHGFGLLVLAAGGFAVLCEQLLPLLIARTNPQTVLQLLLPSFRVVSTPLLPLTLALVGLSPREARERERERERDREREAALNGRAEGQRLLTETSSNGGTNGTAAESRDREGQEPEEAHGEEQRLLQSIVDFSEILVREVMTPRPDIVAIRDDATVADLRKVFREQQYSRVPVFHENLDNIAGFVFVKDLILLDCADMDTRSIGSLVRPATFVPETKRVPDLLKEFQRKQVQTAVVVDEYGGTAGLVTIEDMLEEIVGEIRDEYDVESEPVIDEGGGRFIFHGKVDIEEVNQRLNVQIDRQGFETVGGFLLSHLGRVPAVGEQMDVDGLHIEVLDVERRRVNKVRMTRRLVDEPAHETVQ
jgi:CBS domain containing-hemolysin-like protein